MFPDFDIFSYFRSPRLLCFIYTVLFLHRAGLFAVGPDSAGAHPGPVCYRKGGPLTITDANLLLGRLLPSYFPKIFGPGEDEGLDKEETVKAFQGLAKEVSYFNA